ncbi:MAG: CDP-diacylglycerol--serine O-phosphatidyltransferase [Planctomycetes bacterium]|nr:CDP-diacylglycerol--serine O-phosphatidyltransferase [Planctomycetota bacterium]MBL7142999.1 CDP-diacylglycerol--serine O-phosphatidyltransferase [Phycisphaerae bacterium]
MPRSKNNTARKNLLRRVRRQRLKYITILPSLVTILNGICGFAAIVFAGKGATLGPGEFSYFAMSGYMILLAMIADMLDGRLARMNQSTSSFGGQLDSLCDIISFGVAPAFLMLKVLEHKLSGFTGLNPAMETFLVRFIWVAAAGYISCAAIRLARFNVENEEDESAHMSFIGLPTPAAAGVLVSLVILHQDTLPSINVIIYALPFSALGTAALMVSRIRYPHILNQYLRGKKPFAYLIRVLLLLAFVIWNVQAALTLIFCSFAASSFVKWFYYKVIRNKHNIVSAAQSVLTTSNKDQIVDGENIE